ncbi:hypothetical protein B7G60_15030, partial [Staphylococcus aureus]|uniref:hypothetical protein n=1 Tax=Staphylococcus aureus TaxID=1280 RepID=UPI000A2E9E94
MKEFKNRGFGYCFVMAPSRMVDQQKRTKSAIRNTVIFEQGGALMFEPVKRHSATIWQGFYSELVATTPAMKEFKNRGFGYCFVMAPSRMVD